MSDALIQFHSLDKDWLPAPYPAIRAVPEWYKNLPADLQLPAVRGRVGTIKQCLPFLDALGSGYIIPLSGDVHFHRNAEGQLSFECPNGDLKVETHPAEQIAGSPWAKEPVVKFINPWIVVTPPGYSSLFVQPLNQPEIPFKVLAGVVDTDTFYAEVNFPAVCTLLPGSQCTLVRLTPLVQVIPFKRDAWQAEICHADARRLAATDRQVAQTHHAYREQFHQKKSFRS